MPYNIMIQCDECFQKADKAIHYSGTKGWGAICNRCLREVEQEQQEINRHEIDNFGGRYGLVGHQTKPLDSFVQKEPRTNLIKTNKTHSDMSKAEEISRKLKDRFNTDTPYKSINDWALNKVISDMMQAHTRQRLDELKEKVGGMKRKCGSNVEYNSAINDAITLIDEVINE